MSESNKLDIALTQVHPFAGISQVNKKAAGVDVGAQEIVDCVGGEANEQWMRTFGTYTTDLKAIAKWLKEWGIESVAMESTRVYWIPLFEEAEADYSPCILAHNSGPGTPPYAQARRVSISELLGGRSIALVGTPR